RRAACLPAHLRSTPRNTMPRIQRQFLVAVVAQRRVADFDDEQRVRPRRELTAVEIRPRREQHQVRFRLRPLAQADRPLHLTIALSPTARTNTRFSWSTML